MIFNLETLHSAKLRVPPFLALLIITQIQRCETGCTNVQQNRDANHLYVCANNNICHQLFLPNGFKNGDKFCQIGLEQV